MPLPWEEFQAKDKKPWEAFKSAAPAPAAPPPQLSAPSIGSDVLKSVGSGLRQGVEGIGGMFGDPGQTSGYVAGWLAQKLGASPETAETIGSIMRRVSPMPFAPTTREVQGLTNAVAGEAYQPQTVPGEYARTVSQFAPNALAGPGGIARKMAMAVIPALASETAGQLTKGTEAEPYARGVAALAGGVATAGKNANALKSPKIPAMDELNAMKTAAYERAEQAGVAFTPTGVSKLRDGIVKDFADRAFLPENEPGAAAVLKKIDELQGQNVTFKGLDAIRKMAGNAYIPGNKSNNALTAVIINHIDDLATKPGTGDVLMGDATAGAAAYSEARNLASRLFKAEKVNEAVSKAELRAASTGSGGNADNATRQNLRRVLEKPRGFTGDEQAALEKVVRGTTTQNALRLAGKLSPSGNGLMAALGIGGTMVNPMVGLASLGGMGAKTVADSMTNKNVQQLLDIIAAGGSKAATQAGPAPFNLDALIRTLLAAKSGENSAKANAPVKQPYR